ncbi:TraR/DksA family transcriptional regulator [Simkania negevensis]|uniref:TraR/DksA family transcriptional regulator n=1 Tax=Simkania negevensis TaxID=83561 RepID=A0ABS3ATF7_9BACT|nr:TraR/DksA family transcriptional regulator [Simkania negevensis]
MALSKSKIEEFRKALLAMRANLTQNLKEASVEVKKVEESTGYSQHQADEGTDDFDRTISLELSSREYDILKQIDRALEKINENSYGICDITEKPIPLKRLEAIPYATMTVEAQQMLERGEI